MCRIAGIASLIDVNDSLAGLEIMLDSLAHGGPDDAGTYIDDKVAFGHRRLAIIDLSSAGHQPMLTRDSQLIISFNGEIYNYQSLKKELELLGVVFNTKTDTEVILYAYQQWGVHAFDRLQGIFAFSLYDKKKNKVLLVRDHIGVKPLYYFLDNKELIFASEVRAFKALKPDWKENEDWKILFLAFGSIPHPATTLSNVFQLPPGSYLELQLTDFTSQVNYYYKANLHGPFITETHEFLKLMHDGVREAVQKNLISDAPLGIFLSGGIDSSLLTLLTDRIQEKVKTISINFEEASFDERPFQNLVVSNTQHVEHISHMLTEQTFWDQLDDVWRAMDQPSVDGVNSYFVSKCAREDGLKVVLSGLGADEIFGGYKSINRVKWLKRFHSIPFKRWIAGIIGHRRRAWNRLMFLTIPGAVGDYLFLRGIHTPDSIAKLLDIPEERVWQVLKKIIIESPDTNDDKEYASFLESNIYMSNQLLKDTDYMSMWHGLEVRVPFLDIELIKKVQMIKPTLRNKKGWPKYLLTASCDNILPHEIVFRKKNGFTFPFSLWMRNNADRIRSLLPVSDAANKLLNDFEKGRIHWSKCWSMAVIQQFGPSSVSRTLGNSQVAGVPARQD